MKLAVSIYLPKRRAVDSHEPPTPTFGLGNIAEKNKYVPVVDIDQKLSYKQLIDVVRTGWNIFGLSGYVIVNTMKGHHVIWETTVNWKQLNTLWTKLKHILDHHWITLQRKRKYAILRVRGKYIDSDLCIYEEVLSNEDPCFEKWYSLYKHLMGGKKCQASH